ncbi:hypothetical protein CCAX7_15350 [Capsulimonas corticalis]|uniref:Uncharacterized protein n=1 Tax=Capsulimonas corticalis TaxID=2219043 RepID=A0A402CZC0_9BACT|nr:ABC transporter ATP-binding protein [Capsulimonas corticalis]BDI29484.1 hypothetical protein CCAX7_15350 [Capsulimonas corticalis]
MAENKAQKEDAAPPPLMGRGFGPGARMMGKVEKAKDRRGVLRRLWGYLRHQRAALIATAVMVAASVFLNLAGPFLLGRAIDKYILRRDLHGLAHLCVLMLIVYAANSLLTWLQSYIMAGASQRTVREIRKDLFARLQHLPLGFFDRRPNGELMSRLTNDVENINQVLSDSVTQIVSGVLNTVGVTVAMLLLNVQLTAVTLITITTITVALNRWVATRTRAQFRLQQAALGKLNGFIEETITAQRVVKAYHQEPAVITEFAASNRELRQAATRA